MSGSSNFLQWNPSQANQETDSTYNADSQRVGGAADNTPFPAELANKLFYQLSTGIAALMQMMAAKGFNCQDTNLGTLASVLSAIVTTADLKSGVQVLSWSSTVTCDAGRYNFFYIPLNGNTTINIINATPGQTLSFIFTQDGVGGRTVGWTGLTLVNGSYQPNRASNTSSVITIDVASNGSTTIGAFKTPSLSYTGIDGVDIGRSIAGQGVFTNLTASGSTSLQGATAQTPDTNDVSTKIATTAFVKSLLGQNFSAASPGYKIFSDGFMIQWGSGPSGGSGGVGISYPTPFPTQVFAVLINPTGTLSSNYAWTTNVTNSGFTAVDNGTSPTVYWIAVGH